MRKKILIAIFVTLLLTLAIAGALGYFLISNKNRTIDELRELSASSKALAFAKDMKANYEITPSDIIEIAVKDSSFAAGGYYKADGSSDFYHHIITKGDDGKDKLTKIKAKKEDLYGRIIKVNASKNTPILDSILYAKDEGPDMYERIEEFNFLSIPSDLVENDYVDIRIQFPTGEDYSVLAGKKIEKYAGNTTVFMKLNEEEIMKMGSAIIEAYMQKGVRLYAIKYTDPATQLYKEEIVDYVEKYQNGIDAAVKALENLSARKYAADFQNQFVDENGNPVFIMTENIDGVAYATEESYGYIRESDRKEIEAKSNKIGKDDISVETISKYSGISVANVEAIKEALEINDEKALAYYKVFREQTRIGIKCTYPVKDEVLQVVRANPNILEEIKAEFDKTSTVAQKYDKYVELEKQLAAAPEVSYTGEKTKAEIKKEMEAIVEERTGNIQSSISKEYDEQRARRVAYLQSLVKGK
jgi:hypothetical protein